MIFYDFRFKEISDRVQNKGFKNNLIRFSILDVALFIIELSVNTSHVLSLIK
jgi:hypothetical protein